MRNHTLFCALKYLNYNCIVKIKELVFMMLILSILLSSIGYLSYDKKQKDNAKQKQHECDLAYKKIYLTLDETYSIYGEVISNDENIVIVNNNQIIGVGSGNTTIIVNGCIMDVEVSDLYTLPIINNNKPYIVCGEYSYEDNIYLDNTLKRYINDAGYKTRAGVVTAARFLTLQFKNKLSYFYENGRFGNDGIERRITDGEGRYYHEGFYISNEKMRSISPSNHGPSIWGCDLYENYNEIIKSNGLDCSGFVCWALLNGGYEPGDIGAGPEEDVFDLTDLGEKVYIDDLQISQLKVGDLVGFDGHIGIIIGIDNSNIYVAQMYWEGDLQVSAFSYTNFLHSDWEYVMLMDSYYINDGNLTNYWH